MPIVLSFSNHKGGTGKTTSTVNIACVLRDKGKKTLVVDMDPQGNLSYSLSAGRIEYTTTDWLLGHASAKDCIYESGGIYVSPASVAITEAEEEIRSHSSYSTLLKEKLEDTDFDFVLIDCPPAMGVFTKMALTASDFVIIPMLLEVLSIQGLRQILNYIEEIKLTSNPHVEVLGVLGVCVNESRRLTDEVLEYIDNAFPVNVFNNRVRNNVKAAEAPSFAKSVIDYAPGSTSARDYKTVTEEILKRIEHFYKHKHISQTV